MTFQCQQQQCRKLFANLSALAQHVQAAHPQVWDATYTGLIRAQRKEA